MKQYNPKKNGYSNRVRLAKLAIRREQADERNSAWQSLSIPEKIKSLKSRRGGSRKQINKLEASL